MFLILGEQLYRSGLWLVKQGYRRGILKTHRMKVPVISVGNLTWGGTGKTPLVMMLARALEKKGYRVAVLTRGYGADEAAMMAERLQPVPVMVGPDRVATGRRAVEEMGVDLLLLDDGYQQWRLKKDVEILALDAAAPLGNGHLIPRGTLREPAAAAARANLIIVKESAPDAAERKAVTAKIRALNGAAPIFFMRYQPQELWRWTTREVVPLRTLKGQKVCTLAGLGHPQSFEATVASLGAAPALKYRVRDHHPYTAGEMLSFLSRCRRHGISKMITTAKDAVRLPGLLSKSIGPELKGVDLLVLEVDPLLDPDESELLHRIDTLLARARG